MKIRPWLVGAVSVTAASFGFSTAATATTHRTVSHAVHIHALNASPAGPLLRHLTSKTVINNPVWAGYVAPANKNVQLRFVAVDFNVPSLNCANSPAGSSGPASVVQNVGLDGFTDSAYEATGIFSTCVDSTTAQYQGFYQVGSTAQVSSVAVSPGDAIQASVYYNAGTKQYNFVLKDVTLGQFIWNINAPCPSGTTCRNSSAEAVTGAALGIPPAFTLADFGMENFTGGAVTSRDGLKGGFGPSRLWGSAQLVMKDTSNGTTMANPSSLAGGTAFNTTWRAAS